MKRIDFENGTVTENILSAALPMLAAQILSLLYNIVDRICFTVFLGNQTDEHIGCVQFPVKYSGHMNLCFVFCHRQLSSIHENSQTEGVGNEVRQRASKDLANNLNLAMVTIYTFLLFFCCFGCYKGEKPGNKGFSPATGSATG